MTDPEEASPPLDAEQTLHLLDHLTWSGDEPGDRWESAARHIGQRVTDRPVPTAAACGAAAGRLLAGRPGTRAPDRAVLDPAVFDRTALYRAKYDALALLHPDDWLTYMNMGYQDEDTRDEPEAEPAAAVAGGPARLYGLLAGALGLADSDVLDIGCGRGGGAALLAATPGVRSVVGADLSPRNVEFCDRVHRADSLCFVRADAARLPFTDAAFDGVTMVESAHCFPRLDACLAQARRVLRPGGRLAFADEWPAARIPELAALVTRAGLRVVDQADITEGVLRSLSLLPPRVTRLLATLPEGPRRRSYERFFRDRIGGDSAGLYRSGRYVYLRLSAVRDG
ncbi:class I SAM-dependent methyltransferase [Streptomyces sp. NPDC051569]|uniref:class I SAM-dependent methyltransferase n=1 Tax=Streptomyces sp. NPDC051569 TaxID=3365661 RepID=UPI0037A0ED52